MKRSEIFYLLSFFLWLILVFLSRFNLKPEIKMSLFFYLFLVFFLSANFAKILSVLTLGIYKLNNSLKKQNFQKTIHQEMSLTRQSFLFLGGQLIIFFKNLPHFLKKLQKLVFQVLKTRAFWKITVGLLIFTDLFLLKPSFDLIIIAGVLILLVLSLTRKRTKEGIFISLGFAGFTLLPFLLITQLVNFAEKVAVWVYFLILLGLIEIIIRQIIKSNDQA